MKIRLYTTHEQFRNEFEDVLRAFDPFVKLAEDGNELNVNILQENNELQISINLPNYPNISHTYSLSEKDSDLMKKRFVKRYAKRDLYDYISNLVHVELPYGSLTGIRPTKLFYELENEGKNAKSELRNFFKVSEKKTDLISDIIDAQRGIYGCETNKIDWFVNIPFCPSKCHYCSFISEVINAKKQSNLQGYVQAIVRDIDSCKNLLPSRRAIYVGGGTPTSLPADLLDEILARISANGVEEFTVEAGRPDTLTQEKLEVLKARGVTRVSVNPQTFKDETLALIGRKHTGEDIFKAYDLVRKVSNFDVNMDFITMLPNESFADFKHSIDTAISLAPENITVHSLSIKRGSVFAENNYDNFSDGLAFEMSAYATEALEKAGYQPYYMYRQKNTTGRLENVGYAKRGKACLYNVDIMEETHGIYASGAGAISKRLFGNGLIERLAEVKDIKGYIERVDELIEKKIKFFS